MLDYDNTNDILKLSTEGLLVGIDDVVNDINQKVGVVDHATSVYKRMDARNKAVALAVESKTLSVDFMQLAMVEQAQDLTSLGMESDGYDTLSIEKRLEEPTIEVGLTFNVNWQRVGKKIWNAIVKLVKLLIKSVFKLFKLMAQYIGIISARGERLDGDVKKLKSSMDVLKEYVTQSNGHNIPANDVYVENVKRILSTYWYIKNEKKRSIDIEGFYEQQVKGGLVLTKSIITIVEDLMSVRDVQTPSTVHEVLVNGDEKLFLGQDLQELPNEIGRTVISYNRINATFIRFFGIDRNVVDSIEVAGELGMFEAGFQYHPTNYTFGELFNLVVVPMLDVDYVRMYEGLASNVKELESIITKTLKDLEDNMKDKFEAEVTDGMEDNQERYTAERLLVTTYASTISRSAAAISKDFVRNFKDLEMVTGGIVDIVKPVVNYVDSSEELETKGMIGLIQEYIKTQAK